MTVIILNIATNRCYLIDRTLWVKERSGEWWDRIVNGHLTKEELVENFRMVKDTFMYLCNELRSEMRRYYFSSNHSSRKACGHRVVAFAN